jgi:hypothetical protein
MRRAAVCLRVVLLVFGLVLRGATSPRPVAAQALPMIEFIGGSAGHGEAIVVDTDGSVYVAGQSTHADVATTPSDPCVALASGTTGGDTQNGTAFVAKFTPAGVCDFFTYLGGTGEDTAYALALDAGAVYVTGRTGSADFPASGTFAGADDAWVARLDQTGAVVWSTFVGSSGEDAAYGIAVAGGNVYVSGTVDPTADSSVPLPMTTCAAQPAFGGGQTDAFVAMLDAATGALVRTTYLGGSDADDSRGTVAADATGVYVVGTTDSLDFPASPGAVKPGFTEAKGTTDAFVTKFDPQLTTRLYSTFLGGIGNDVAQGVAVDDQGDAYVVGTTESAFPTTSTTLKHVTTTTSTSSTSTTMLGCAVATTSTSTTIGGGGNTTTTTVPKGLHAFRAGAGGDAYVAKLDASGTQLVWATHVGGTKDDRGFSIVVGATHEVTLAGDTASGTFTRLDAKKGTLKTHIYKPGRKSTSCPSFLRPCHDVFVMQLDANGLPCPVDAKGACPKLNGHVTPYFFASLGGTGPELQPQVGRAATGGDVWVTGLTGSDDGTRCEVTPKPHSCKGKAKYKPFAVTVGDVATPATSPPGFPGNDAVDYGTFLVEIPQ